MSEPTRPHILALSLPELKNLCTAQGLKPFRATQVWDWVHAKGVTDITAMNNLSAPDKQTLATALDTTLPTIAVDNTSRDGTRKFLLTLADNHQVEMVYIPEGDDPAISDEEERESPTAWKNKFRGTLCISSQVGCTLTCRFCHTGTQGLARNLTAAEVVAQVYIAKKLLGDFDALLSTNVDSKAARDEKMPFPPERGAELTQGDVNEHRNDKEKHFFARGRRLTNIVFMGMGEPLYNFDNVVQALKVLTDKEGLAFGGRRITISTSGVVPQIVPLGEALGEETGVNLAVSLHAPNDDLRTKIMPINNKYPLETLLDALKNFRLRQHRRITFEYVMLDGVNDTPACATELITLCKELDKPLLVNLIPYNPWPGSPFKRSSVETIKKFRNQLTNSHIAATVRKTRGEDVLAACGQLRTETSGRNTISIEYPSVVAQYGTPEQRQKVKIV